MSQADVHEIMRLAEMVQRLRNHAARLAMALAVMSFLFVLSVAAHALGW